MIHAVVCSLAVFALLHVPAASSGSGSCPTLFNFYAHPTDCSKFYRCFWGSPIEFSCPAGTHWNQHILTCDHAYNVPCATAILEPIYKLVKDDGYGYQKVGFVNYDGSKGYEKGNYGYVTNKGYDNGNYGYESNKGDKVYEGSYVRSNDYDNYGSYSGTSGYTKQTYPPKVGHNYGGFAARAGYTNYNNGYARPQYVTNGYARPQYVTNGYIKPNYGVTQREVTLHVLQAGMPELEEGYMERLHTPPGRSGSCPTLFNFYAHPTDCSKFYRCFWGSPIEFSCPAGTHWNQHILTCDHAYNVPCATAILEPIYKLVKDDGYGYQKVGFVNYDGSKGYEKGNYGYVTNKGYDNGNYGYESNKGDKVYEGSYVRSNDYDNYGSYSGTSGYTKQTYPPKVGHNYGGFAARAGYTNYNNGYARPQYVTNGYARPQYVTNGYIKPNYGGYSAGGYASRAASGYARVGGRVYGKASYATRKYGSWNGKK
ncbi:uncharacterized protein LOC124278672 [Haliotis rubra]|uniref:uncharacterized protein LOC124278672 n=1 Tax=Haliotis rubra TaxID=36100 RepID=UPI001EE52084|nr:uncharacterized protein LOC124278672 [Haliotis rubra]